MKNDTSLESSNALLLESAKNCKSAKSLIFVVKLNYIVKMLAKNKFPKNEKIFIFEKPLTMPFQICKI